MRFARPLALLLLCALALGLAGCGNKEEIVTEGDTEGVYLDVGELKYQVQLSRQLNPADAEDRGYVQGIAPGTPALNGRDEVWFGVFMRVENETGEELPTSREFLIRDTREKEFRPLPLGEANAFRYIPQTLDGNGQLPEPGTPPFSSPVGGSLLLFRLDRPALENRPLELIIRSPSQGDEGVVELDV